MIGSKSWIWLIIGAPLVVALLTLHSILLEAWRELAEIRWIRLFIRLISLLRNAIALLAMFRLAQAINQAIATQSGLSPWQALWRIVLGG